MKKQTVVRWIWGILFAIFEIFFLIVAFRMDSPFSEKVFAFLTFSLLLLFIFFWLSSLTACLFEKNNPQRWRDFVIILLLNIFGAIYFRRRQQIRNYQPPKDPETFKQKFSKWLDENHFSLEYCIKRNRKAGAFVAVMFGLSILFLGLRIGYRHALFVIPDGLKPLAMIVFVLPVLGLLAFLLRYVYRDWKRTDHIPFLLSAMFLQANAGNSGKGMLFLDKEQPYYKKPLLSAILMGDFFLFLSIWLGLTAIFAPFPDETLKMQIDLRIGGITLASLFFLIASLFQTTWFIYFHPNKIFSVTKHYQKWKTASAILAILPMLGFITMYIMLFIQEATS
ncbi:MAG: hypothetical protein CR975_03515 [Gammaproteobacteria bacterium]|nr:MAG: hypothetical protein CR975_03515 [Gammaproteobacteria bacterium]